MKVIIYTDGAASGKPGPGGYGVVMESSAGHRKELSGGFARTTNNRMELLAVIKGLQALKSTEHQVQVVSDSKYVVDAINKGCCEIGFRKDLKTRKTLICGANCCRYWTATARPLLGSRDTITTHRTSVAMPWPWPRAKARTCRRILVIQIKA